LDRGLKTPHHKNPACCKMLHRASDLVGSRKHDNIWVP
jgi:hypothetical protein